MGGGGVLMGLGGLFVGGMFKLKLIKGGVNIL